MKQILSLLLILSSCVGYGQTGLTYHLAEPGESLYDTANEHIIGDTILWCNTKWDKIKKDYVAYPSKYWVVKYDYGNPPPDGQMIMKWLLCYGVPPVYKEWSVSYSDEFTVDGDDPVLLQRISFSCPNHRSLLKKYTYDVVFSANEMSVKQNKDTTQKYFNIKHPEFKSKPIK